MEGSAREARAGMAPSRNGGTRETHGGREAPLPPRGAPVGSADGTLNGSHYGAARARAPRFAIRRP